MPERRYELFVQDEHEFGDDVQFVQFDGHW